MQATATPRLGLARDELLGLEQALAREWLETDGRGGYAASTVHLCNRRRYHGLLVAPFAGTAQRHVFLSRLEETVHATGAAPATGFGGQSGERAFPLSMARYRGVYSPLGHAHAERFELAPFPRWTYRLGGSWIERELLVCRGSPIVLVRWRLGGDVAPLELRLRPLLACREADALQRENLALDSRVERLSRGLAFSVRPYAALPRVAFTAEGAEGRFEADPVWYRGVEYALDLERGYEGHEDLFSPGELRLELERGRWCVLAATIDELPREPGLLFASQVEERERKSDAASIGAAGLVELGADDFLYRAPTRDALGRRGERLGVIAGFPWFGEWGRDTAISLPGLLLARGRVEDCGDALCGLVRFLRRGLLPNIFGLGVEDSHYGSADAALWFARAVQLFDRAGGDQERLCEVLLPALIEIAERCIEGGDLAVHSDASGMLWAGSNDLNATWMDARTASGPVTPRAGCAVELNALWYQLLAYLAELCERCGERARVRGWRALAELCGRSFLERLWIEDERRLADVWRPEGLDASVRPNMVLAAALELSPLSTEQRAGVVQRAELELLTPRGLRTLSPADPAYRGEYRGSPEARDQAYHQGTAWPWLLGFHVEAALRAFPGDRARAARLAELVDGLLETAREGGLGHVAEVFDGDPPQRPGGCFAQAWSTAELLRARHLLGEAQA
jgi:predicted glycogen debranching enzyme